MNHSETRSSVNKLGVSFLFLFNCDKQITFACSIYLVCNDPSLQFSFLIYAIHIPSNVFLQLYLLNFCKEILHYLLLVIRIHKTVSPTEVNL